MSRERERARQAFARGLDRKREWFSWHNWAEDAELEYECFKNLAVDERMDCVWRALKGDDEDIDLFLGNFITAFEFTLFTSDIEEDYREKAAELNAVNSAIDVLTKYCGRFDRVSGGGFSPRNALPILRTLGNFAQRMAAFEQAELEPLRFISQQRDLLKVHMPRLMVQELTKWFGRPGYELVAATISVYFDLPENKQLTYDQVRMACNRHDPARLKAKADREKEWGKITDRLLTDWRDGPPGAPSR